MTGGWWTTGLCLAGALAWSAAARAAQTVEILYPTTHPQRGLIAYGDVAFTAHAIDDVYGVERVEFYINGEQVFADDTYPYSYLWKTYEGRTGLHRIRVVARNTVGRSVSAEADVEVVPTPDRRRDGGTVVRDGLLPPIRPILHVNMRAPCVARGPDGAYYLVGTTGHDPADMNGGIEMWKSDDLQHWRYIGLVWNFDRDGTWQKPWGTLNFKPFRAAHTPRITWMRGQWYILFGQPGRGSTLLVATTGEAAGPYRNAVMDDKPLFAGVDGSLFEDDDGSVYLVYGDGRIVLLNDRWEPAGPVHIAGIGGGDGAQLFTRDGRYYLAIARRHESGRYSSFVGIGDAPTGPFADWHEAVPCGGHNTFFQDTDGRWWSTFFGHDDHAPWRDWPALLRIEFDDHGRIRIADEQPSWVLHHDPPNDPRP